MRPPAPVIQAVCALGSITVVSKGSKVAALRRLESGFSQHLADRDANAFQQTGFDTFPGVPAVVFRLSGGGLDLGRNHGRNKPSSTGPVKRHPRSLG